MSEDAEKVYEDLYERGLGDGLPIIVPTKERIKKMLEFTDKKPDDSLGHVPPSENEVTVETTAANAVMAGCKPEYFPVVVAVLEAACDRANLRASIQPHRANLLVVCNGPIAKELGISSGWDIGPTTLWASPNRRPNMTIGRAMMLTLYNVAFGQNNPARIENPSAFGTCIRENEEMSPWEPYHVEKGFDKNTSTVSVKNEANLRGLSWRGRASGVFNIDFPNWVKGFIPNPAGNLTGPYRGSSSVIILPPGWAKMFTSNGMSKKDIREYMYENCRMDWRGWYANYPPQIREDVLNLLFSECPAWYRDLDKVPLFPNHGKDIEIIVAGPQPTNYGPVVNISDHGSDPLLTKPIAFTDGTPAKSVFDFKNRK